MMDFLKIFHSMGLRGFWLTYTLLLLYFNLIQKEANTF